MSYLVLARKSRPQTFAEVVGQRPVVRTLQNALQQDRVAHALLFSGVRGTGKTTLARIMAKALNCEQGPAIEPCNACRSCRDITDGTSLDLQEVDGASNRGIQEIRELKEKIRFMPTSSRYKIFIIDEVHMLTTEAFNALLKTLEEPPSHVYFVFATTELHKVPVTILSRCQRYELKRLNPQDLEQHFRRLSEAEGFRIDSQALAMVVREAGGSVRDGLSLLDQLFSYCGTTVNVADVIEVLGLVSHDLVASLAEALLQGNLDEVYSRLHAMYVHGTDIKRFCNDLLDWFRGLIICTISKKPGVILDLPEETVINQQRIAAQYNLEVLTAFFDLLVEGLEKVAFSQQPRLALELTFIRAVQLHNVVPVTQLIARFNQLLSGSPTEVPAIPVTPSAAIEQSRRPTATSLTIDPPSAVSYGEAPIQNNTPEPKQSQEMREQESPPTAPTEQEKQTEPEQEQTPLVAAPTPAREDGQKKIRQQWDPFLKYVLDRQRWMATTLQLSSSVQREGNTLIIHFDDPAICSILKSKDHLKSLTEFALDFFQENLRIHFEVPGSNTCAIDQANGLAPQQERRALANDALVQTALDIFTGQVGDIRIGPRYRKSSATEERNSEENGSLPLDD